MCFLVIQNSRVLFCARLPTRQIYWNISLVSCKFLKCSVLKNLCPSLRLESVYKSDKTLKLPLLSSDHLHSFIPRLMLYSNLLVIV